MSSEGKEGAPADEGKTQDAGGAGKEAEPADDPLAERKARIRAAFSLFDKEGRGCIIQEECSTVSRYLGVFPSEKSVVESVLPAIQEDEPTSFVTYERFEKWMLEVMSNGEYQPDNDDMLTRAFKAIDKEGKGWIDADELSTLLTTHGTPFRPKELEGFLSKAKDMETGRIFYEDYVQLFTTEVEEIEKEFV